MSSTSQCANNQNRQQPIMGQGGANSGGTNASTSALALGPEPATAPNSSNRSP